MKINKMTDKQLQDAYEKATAPVTTGPAADRKGRPGPAKRGITVLRNRPKVTHTPAPSAYALELKSEMQRRRHPRRSDL